MMSVSEVLGEGITNPPIDDLLELSGSKYALVIHAAKRARQINRYYSDIGEGMLQEVGPLVDVEADDKSLSIALRELSQDRLVVERPVE